MKQLTFLFMLLMLMACGVEDVTKKTPLAATDDYSIDGKIATVSTSAGLKKMLADEKISEIKLNSGNYSEEYELNIPKTITGSKSTTINKFSINTDGAKIDSPVISTLLAGRKIGNGELELTNVTIKKDAIFEGGGSNSIKIFGTSTFEGMVVLNKPGLSLKMSGDTKITDSILILQPASLLGNDEDTSTGIPNIAADIVVNYSSTSSFTTTINVQVNNLVLCATVGSIVLDANAQVKAMLKLGNSTITGNGKVVDENLQLTPKLLELILTSNFMNLGDIKGNFALPTKISTTDITWTSSNDDIISITDGTTKVVRASTTTNVKLSATFTIDSKESTKDFTVKVIGMNNTIYTVKFNSDSATTPAFPSSIDVVFPATTIGSLPVEPEYTAKTVFMGWFTSPSGGGTKFLETTPVTKDLTVYAHSIYYENGINLALNKTATSSSNETDSLHPNLAIDGINNNSSRWASSSNFSTAQWLIIDLGSSTTFNKVIIKFEAGSKDYDVDYSNDLKTWTTIKEKNSTENSVTETISAEKTLKGQYIRFLARSTTGTAGVSIYELEVYNN